MFRILCIYLLLVSSAAPLLASGEKPIFQAVRTTEAPRIDGQLDEALWAAAPVARQFVQRNPQPGAPASYPTEVQLLYDDQFLYIGARLTDARDSILQQITERDRFGNSDAFGVLIDAFQDGINASGFFVNAAGVQIDSKYSAAAPWGDRNWDAVWESRVVLHADGWTVEMAIPYSALRFPNETVQTWNINFTRTIRRKRESSYWSPVDPAVEGLINQSGQLAGIENIKPPVRLQATPFVAAYANTYSDPGNPANNESGQTFSAGMDIKYGINDAFTLDMTLIPDFGEARSDNNVLNLSAFEVRFDETRQFFQEGTELFNKGGLFYSRRIGGAPINRHLADDDLTETEEVIRNPAQTQLLNATKVSGRTVGGLGVGVFNAVANRTQALIRDTESGEERFVKTSPLTNYNVLVFDQNLPNNSFVTLLNTNVWRNGDLYDANVTGTVFSLRNKANSYAVSGNANLSQKYFAEGADLGYNWRAEVEKTSGNVQWGLGYLEESDTYDPNDLGFLFNNNSRVTFGDVSYQQFEPVGPFNSYRVRLSSRYERLFAPNVYTDYNVGVDSRFTTRRFFTFGANVRVEPFTTYDYFDSRTPGLAFEFPTNVTMGGFISTDYSKPFAIDVRLRHRVFSNHRAETGFVVAPRLQVNDKLSFRLRVNYDFLRADFGYVGHTQRNVDYFDLTTLATNYRPLDAETPGYLDVPAGSVVFGERDRNVFNNTINANYAFTNRMTLSFRLRHYWTSLAYQQYLDLREDGTLTPSNYRGTGTDTAPLHDANFNAFNVDLIYRWRFAPGSDIFIVWKNAIFRNNPDLDASYFQNVGELLDSPQTNNFSVKVIYFLDYALLRG